MQKNTVQIRVHKRRPITLIVKAAHLTRDKKKKATDCKCKGTFCTAARLTKDQQIKIKKIAYFSVGVCS